MNDVAAGVVSGPTLRPCVGGVCTRSLVPGGSVTKAWTAVAVLQGIDQGVISMDTPAYTLLDKVVQPQCGYTMLTLFKNNVNIQQMTVGHLLAMKSGVKDYDDDQVSETNTFFLVAWPGRWHRRTLLR